MAVTTEYSDQIDNAEATPVVRNHAVDVSGKLRVAYFNFTQGAAAGDATSTQGWVDLPAGRVRIFHDLGRFDFSAFGASRTLDVGLEAYTDWQGTSVAADATALASAVDVSSAGAAKLSEADDIAQTTLIQSKNGVRVSSAVAGGTIPAAATLNGFIVYAME